MSDLTTILSDLRKEEKQLEVRAAQVRSAIAALTGGAMSTPGQRMPAKKTAKRGRRTMTAAQKKAISRRMKKMWAAKKKLAKG